MSNNNQFNYQNSKEWVGLDPARFIRYKNYINRQGFCGSYSSAALLDYLMTWLYGQPLNIEQTINAFRYTTDQRFIYHGTYIWDIIHGLKEVLGDNSPYRIRWTLRPQTVVKQVLSKTNLPIIVGTLGLLSDYGNHWMLAYAYRAQNKQNYQLLCYDNHGSSQAVINSQEMFSAIWLELDPQRERKEKDNDKTI